MANKRHDVHYSPTELSVLARFYEYQQEQQSIQQQQNDEEEISLRETEELNQRYDFCISQGLSLLSSLSSDVASMSGVKDTVRNEEYDIEILINEIRNYQCIWNTSTRFYHDIGMRKTAWKNLSLKIGKLGR